MTTRTIAKRYRHYKGDIYNIVATGEHADTNTPMIAYQRHESWEHPEIWFHDVSDFFCEVEYNGTFVQRFTPLAAE